MSHAHTSAIAQLDGLLKFYEENRNHQNLLSEPHYVRFVTSALAAVDRIAGPNSAYAEQIRNEVKNTGVVTEYVAHAVWAVMQGLRDDVEGGFLDSVGTLAHAEVFGDFLEMAQHLLSQEYKDAAAVIGGGTLESHLRRLCVREEIDIEVQANSGPKPKKAEQMNSDLYRAEVYSSLEQKSVTAWLDLRNKAAHGKYGDYEAEQVTTMLDGIRGFLTRYPA